MTITIAICAMVELSRATQKWRKAGIRSGSGRKLTPRLLGGGRGSGNRWRGPFPPKLELPDQRRHGQALHEDRESDDREGCEDDRIALRHGRWDRQGERKGERTAQSAPEQRVLIGSGKSPARAAEQKR